MIRMHDSPGLAAIRKAVDHEAQAVVLSHLLASYPAPSQWRSWSSSSPSSSTRSLNGRPSRGRLALSPSQATFTLIASTSGRRARLCGCSRPPGRAFDRFQKRVPAPARRKLSRGGRSWWREAVRQQSADGTNRSEAKRPKRDLIERACARAQFAWGGRAARHAGVCLIDYPGECHE